MWAQGLIFSCPVNNKRCEADTLALFVVNEVKYQNDPWELETIITPIEIMRRYKNGDPVFGDCDCKSTLLLALLTAVGIEAKFRAVATGKFGRKYDHVHVVAKINGEWVSYDPSGTERTINMNHVGSNTMLGACMPLKGIELGNLRIGETNLGSLDAPAWDAIGNFFKQIEDIYKGKELPDWYKTLRSVVNALPGAEGKIKQVTGLARDWNNFKTGTSSWITWLAAGVIVVAAFSIGRVSKKRG
jgi:hypothetical protein